MNISITNLGAVKEANIDLNSKLTLFCGENSTGKTYISYVLYSIIEGVKPFNHEFYRAMSSRRRLFELTPLDLPWEDLFTKGIIEYTIKKETTQKYIQKYEGYIKKNLFSLFAISPKESIFFKDTNIVFEINDHYLKKSFKQQIDLEGNILTFDKKENSDIINISLEQNLENKAIMPPYIPFYIESKLGETLLSNLYLPTSISTILPVERNSIYTFSKELSIRNHDRYDKIKELILEDRDPEDLFFMKRDMVRYPKAIRDCLRIAEDLYNIQKIEGAYYNLGAQIEEKLLKGKIIVNKLGSIEFKMNNTDTRLSFHQSSAIVKTLASLVIYLKHIAEENTLIIIDEPEMNLHPENQIILTRIFAKLINSGLRLLISTDSDYIVRELNNLIMIGSLKKEKGDNYSDDLPLKYKENGETEYYIFKEDIKAYMFQYNGDPKCTVTNIPIDRTGFSLETFDTTIDELNTNSDNLYDLLELE